MLDPETNTGAPRPETSDALLARRRGSVFAVGCMAMLTAATAWHVLSAGLGPISRGFGRDFAERGRLLSLAPLGTILSTLICGWLSDRWGERYFILAGLALLVVGLALAAWAPTYGCLMGGMLLIGLSTGFLESPLSALVSDLFAERRARTLNLMQVFYNVGAVGGPAVLGAALWGGLNWRWGFGVFMVVAMGALALGVKALPTGRETLALRRKEAGDTGRIRWWLTLAVGTVMFFYVGAELGVAFWCANYVESFGIPAGRAALAVSAFWLFMGLGRLAYVPIVARWGYLGPLLASAVLSGLAATGAAVAPSGLWAAAACALAGLFMAGCWPTIIGYATCCSTGRTGTVFALVVSAGALGAAVAPPFAGWVAEGSRHGLRAAMAVAAVSAGLQAAVTFGLWLRERGAVKTQVRCEKSGL